MQEFKIKVCLMCCEEYKPTSPKQKFCTNCKDKAIKLAQAERDRKRNRLKHSIVYEKVCPACNITFETFNSKKKYCGSDVCELKRRLTNGLKTDQRRKKLKISARRYHRILRKSIILKYIKSYVEKFKYILISAKKYKNTHHSKLVLKCNEDHLFETTFHYFKYNKNRCPICYQQNNYVSKPEQLVRDFIQTNFPELQVIHNDRNILKPKELDIYIPSKNLAIEVCGLYWHSEEVSGRPKSYHYDKMMGCFTKGIHLITIFEDELYDHKDVVFSNIKKALGESFNKINAEDCNIKEITLDEANVFYLKYHLNGKTSGSISYGLFYENKLICACSVDSVIKNNKASKFKLELKRFCTLPDTYLFGGFHKIFEVIKTYNKLFKFNEVLIQCDMRYTSMLDTTYENYGFTMLKQLKFTPHYFKSQKRFKNIPLNGNKEYGKIYDCGYKIYSYKIN